MNEAQVVETFARWLTVNGWTVRTQVDWVDVVAERGDERLIAEAKGHGKDNGAAADILYGQILRRIPREPRPGERYAIVVPAQAERAVLRVPDRVRAMLGLEVFVIDGAGQVNSRQPAP
jgi:hypothetical protein